MGLSELRLKPGSVLGPSLGQSQDKWALGPPDHPFANCRTAEAAQWGDGEPTLLWYFHICLTFHIYFL